MHQTQSQEPGGGAAQSGEAAHGPHGVERWVGHPVCVWGGGGEGVGGEGKDGKDGEGVGRRRGRKNQEAALRSWEKRLMPRMELKCGCCPLCVGGGVGGWGEVGEGEEDGMVGGGGKDGDGVGRRRCTVRRSG